MEKIAHSVADDLRESERRFRTAVEQSPLSTQIFAPDGLTISVNPAWERLWDSHSSDVAGYNILHDSQLEAAGIMPLIRKAFEGEAVSLPATFYDPAKIGKPGRKRWVEGYIYPLLYDDESDAFEVALVHYDVTEHKLAEEALRESQIRLSAELAAMHRLQETSTRMIPEGDAEVLYGEILDAAVTIMGSDFASIQRFDPDEGDGGVLRLLDHRGFTPEAAAYWEQVRPTASSSCAQALATVERVIIPDVRKSDTMAGSEELVVTERAGIRAVQTTPLLSRSGKVLGMISTHWREPTVPDERTLQLFDVLSRQAADLIERTRSEQALRASEARFRALFESIDEGFCIIEVLFDEDDDPVDYRFLEVNPAFHRQSGIKDAAGKTVREVVPGAEDHWFTTYGDVAKSGRPIRFINRFEGLNRWFDVFAFRVGEPSQRRVAVLFTDISERQQAYEDLVLARKEAETERLRLQEIFSRAPSAMATLRGPELIVETANPVWLKLLGKTDVVGKALADLAPELKEQGLFDLLKRIYRVGETYNAVELPVLLNRGGPSELDEVLLNVVVQPLFDADHKVSGLLIHAVDVTAQAQARKQVETLAGELERLNESLEQRVEQRTGELERMNAMLKAEIDERLRAESALEISNAALIRSNTELQEFAYVASHDLQEPLRKITTFIDLLRLDSGEHLDELGHEYMNRLQDSARRLSELIHALLTYSRVTTRNLPFQQVDVRESVTQVLSDLEISITESGAQIEVGDLPSVIADPIQVRQLLQNLISNAIKFHRPGERPTVRIYTTEEPANGSDDKDSYASISVEDQGIGFDDQHLDRIFIPFQRLHGRSEYPGTGIGLAICRRIMERHGGSIVGHSRPGKGAVFTARFPVRRVP